MSDPTAHRLLSYGTLHLPEVQRSRWGRMLDGSPDAPPGHRMTTIRITDPAVIETSGTDRHPRSPSHRPPKTPWRARSSRSATPNSPWPTPTTTRACR